MWAGVVVVAVDDRGDEGTEAPGEAQHAGELLELGDALLELDRDWRIVRVNREQERLGGRPRAQTLGRTLWEVWPEAGRPDGVSWREYHRCMDERVSVRFEAHFAPLDLWTAVTAHPTSTGGIAVFFRDISEQKRAAEGLREANRNKDQFLSVLSHELRNPLAPIQNSLHTLAHAEPASDPARRARDIISRQVHHLTRLVDDLLDVRRISAGKLRLRPRPMDLARQVRDGVEDQRPLFARRGIALAFEGPEVPVRVHGDATRLAQAVGNLLQNALKFTDPGGNVVVRVEREGGQARIRVRDDGVGIAPDLAARLFEPFAQGSTTLHRTRSGLGLGLALVRGIAELHGGRASARSEGPGKGSEFVLTLPAVAAAPDEERVPARATPAGSRKVLVIDDQEDTAQSLRDVLELVGRHAVTVAGSAEEGLDAIRRGVPDVVLCDVELAGMDGYELARRIRAAPALGVGRLIALTGHAAPEDVERAFRAGFHFHVPKPPDLERLLWLVAEAPRDGALARLPGEIATGHQEVDVQHAQILEHCERLRTLRREDVAGAVGFLEAYMSAHFEYEERLMEDVGYPELAPHRLTHAAFADELERHRHDLQRDGATPQRVGVIAAAIEGWVTHHVLEEDRLLAEFVRGADGR